jgi:hypothetical protein
MSEEIKTLQECKDEVATRYGHTNWDQLSSLSPTWEYDEAAELYASQFKSSPNQLEKEIEESRKRRE